MRIPIIASFLVILVGIMLTQPTSVLAVLDCAGVDNGTATIDCSTTCCGGNTTIVCASGINCAFECCGGHTGLPCPAFDCGTVCCGGATNVTCFVLSNCGVCQSIVEPITTGEDCNGDCFGSAILDDCAECCEVCYIFNHALYVINHFFFYRECQEMYVMQPQMLVEFVMEITQHVQIVSVYH